MKSKRSYHVIWFNKKTLNRCDSHQVAEETHNCFFIHLKNSLFIYLDLFQCNRWYIIIFLLKWFIFIFYIYIFFLVWWWWRWNNSQFYGTGNPNNTRWFYEFTTRTSYVSRYTLIRKNISYRTLPDKNSSGKKIFTVPHRTKTIPVKNILPYRTRQKKCR